MPLTAPQVKNAEPKGEYSRLGQDKLKELFALEPNETRIYQWSCRGKVKFTSRIKRLSDGVFIFLDEKQGYTVKFNHTALTYGERAWFICHSLWRSLCCFVLCVPQVRKAFV